MVIPPPPQPDEFSDYDPGLRARTIRSLAWTGMQSIAVRLLSLVTFVILARLLSPHDYGVAAIAGVFAALLSLVAAGGFSPTIVQKATIDKTDVDSVFWVSLVIGLVLTGAMCAAAWPIAGFFKLPELRPVLWTLSPMFLAISLGSTQTGLMQRQFRFATLARISVSSNVVATVVGVILALCGAGYWSLVLQTLVAPVLTSLQLWRVSDYRPGVQVSRHRFAEIFTTSRNFMGDNLMTFAYEQVDKFVVGRRLGTAPLGVYSVAYRIVFIMLDVLSRSVQLVALPAFARLQGDRTRLRNGYLSAIRLCTMLTIPSFAFVGVETHDIVTTVFGSQWLPGVASMRIFCAYGIIQSLIAYNNVFLQAVGRSRTVLWLSSIGTAFQVVAVIIAVNYGIAWVAASFLLRAALLAFPTLAVASAAMGGSMTTAIARAIAPPALASAALAGTCLGLLRVPALSSSALALAVDLPLGFLVYAVVLAAVGRRHIQEARHIVAVLRRKGRDDSRRSEQEVQKRT